MRVEGLGFRVEGLGASFIGFRVSGVRFRVERVQGFKVKGFRVWGLGFRATLYPAENEARLHQLRQGAHGSGDKLGPPGQVLQDEKHP